jgi:hypothetical protein
VDIAERRRVHRFGDAASVAFGFDSIGKDARYRQIVDSMVSRVPTLRVALIQDLEKEE